MSKSVSLGVASYGSMKTITGFCLIGAVSALRESSYDVHLTCRQGPYTHWNREMLVVDALDAGVSHLMMVDTDMVFPADGIVKLLGLEKDVVGGFYMMKTTPPVNTIKMDDGNGGYMGEKEWVPPAEPFRCAAVATGFMLIDLDAIKDVPRPLFPCVQPVGEDVAFCKQAVAAGLEIWCDPTIKLGHLGDFTYE
jgi:hypothetical protein